MGICWRHRRRFPDAERRPPILARLKTPHTFTSQLQPRHIISQDLNASRPQWKGLTRSRSSSHEIMSRTLAPDLEAQVTEKKDVPLLPVETEYQVPTEKKLAYLSVYFLLNVSLTIYNKAVLGKVSPESELCIKNSPLISTQFSYPWLLTALHTGSASIGCYLLMLRGIFTLTALSRRDNLILVTFSFLFTINIAISNISL
jgi:hypothetical protein